MKYYPTGISLTEAEYIGLTYLEPDPDAWLYGVIEAKVAARRAALINDWRPRLFADPEVRRIPADDRALAKLIVSRTDYQNRATADAMDASRAGRSLATKPRWNLAAYDSVKRGGDRRAVCASGITINDDDVRVILAYVSDLPDWIMGALMGQVARGKSQLIRRYHPILNDDPETSTFPASEEGLIKLISSRPGFETHVGG